MVRSSLGPSCHWSISHLKVSLHLPAFILLLRYNKKVSLPTPRVPSQTLYHYYFTAPYFALIETKAEKADEGVNTCHDVPEATNIEEEEEREELLNEDPLSNEVPDTDDLYERVVQLSDNLQHTVKRSVAASSAREAYQDRISSENDNNIDSSAPRADNSSSNHSTLTGKAVPTSSQHPSQNHHALPLTPATPTPSSCSSLSSEKSSGQFSDPKVQKAYEKMLKLDERLANVSRREREVKRQRRLLEEEMEEVGAAQPSSGY